MGDIAVENNSRLTALPSEISNDNSFQCLWKWIAQIPWKTALLEHRIYLLMCLAYVAIGCPVIYYVFPELLPKYPAAMLTTTLGSIRMMGAVFAIYSLIHLAKYKPKSPIKSIFSSVRATYLSDANIPRILFGMLGMILVIPLFIQLKQIIPLINPFSYDALFESLDRSIHFGYQPWKLMESITDHPWVTIILQRNYYFWFPVIYVTFFWQVATRNNPVLRIQFISAFIASWIIVGTIFATLFSSFGPIFYEQFYGTNIHVYSQATAYLQKLNSESPLIMFKVRDILWEVYQHNITGSDIKGISAMPSMHVSMVTLLVLFGWRKNKLLGIAYSIFAIMIAVGSVHLLWHYAIDGYAAIILTCLIWWISGIIARRSNLPQLN